MDAEGNGVVYHQEHLGQFDGKMEIPLDSAYSDYVVNIQGLLQWSILGNTVVNGHWVETEVLVRVCDEVGDQYRFGFNGQEKVNEISGMGNHNTAEFWEYDTRLGRRWNVDPVDQISVSNYAVFRNSPLSFVDPKGNYSKLGAHLRSFLTGGSKVSYDEIYDTWTYNKGTKNGIIYKTGLSAKEQSKRIGNYEKPHFEMEGDRNGGFWKGVVEAHEAFWNSSLSRAIIPDKISIGIGGNVAAFAGTGTQPINISILTRGKEPGVYLTPTFNLNAGYGAIVSGGFEFTTSYYTGNPRNITASMLQGSTYGIMASGGYIGSFSLGGSYSPANTRWTEGFINRSVGVGLGYGLFIGGQYQFTPGYGPLWQWKK